MNISFKWLGGGSWMLAVEGQKIVCDPVLSQPGDCHNAKVFTLRRINAPRYAASDLDGVAIWLFTHGHKDHCDLAGLKPITQNSTIIADGTAKKVLTRLGYTVTTTLGWGAKTTVEFHNDISIDIKAVPAIHGLNRFWGGLIGNGNGYWIDILQNNTKYSLYASGDTLPNEKTCQAIRYKPCDLFIANVGSATIGKGVLSKLIGRVTMNVADAALIQQLIASKKTIPIHWDAFEHYREQDIKQLSQQYKFTFIEPGDELHLV